MKKTLLIGCLFIISTNLLSQNLIKNSGFEDFEDGIPSKWEMTAGTPDYINLNQSSDIHNKLLKNHTTNAGKGFMGIVLTSMSSEVFHQELEHKLKRNETYELSCKVLAPMNCKTGLENITISISSNKLNSSNFKTNPNASVLKLTNKDKFINHGQWTEVKIIFKAKGFERFISIGNFNKENSKYIKSAKEKMNPDSGESCNYLIFDNISLKKIDLNNLKKTNSEKIVLEDLFFESGKSDLNPKFKIKLDSIFETISQLDSNLMITGYTDNIGSIESNKILSTKRAESIKKYFVEKGYDKAKIKTKGLHEKNPIMSNDTEYGRSRNRRVEIEIIN